LLPRGLLREPLSSLARADLVMITRCDQASTREVEQIAQELQRWRGTPECVEVCFAPRRLRNGSGEFRPLADLTGERPLAFCGIGNPMGFQKLLASLGVICEPFAFADHHHYGPGDLARLLAAANAVHATCFVTTQKDLVKLPMGNLGGRPVWAIEIAAEVAAGGDALTDALGTLSTQTRRAA
jgi:tetraacyldisaccharide 4'-kinase